MIQLLFNAFFSKIRDKSGWNGLKQYLRGRTHLYKSIYNIFILVRSVFRNVALTLSAITKSNSPWKFNRKKHRTKRFLQHMGTRLNHGAWLNHWNAGRDFAGTRSLKLGEFRWTSRRGERLIRAIAIRGNRRCHETIVSQWPARLWNGSFGRPNRPEAKRCQLGTCTRWTNDGNSSGLPLFKKRLVCSPDIAPH